MCTNYMKIAKYYWKKLKYEEFHILWGCQPLLCKILIFIEESNNATAEFWDIKKIPKETKFLPACQVIYHQIVCNLKR